MTRAVFAVFLALAAPAFVFGAPGRSAFAEIEGPCSGTVRGVDVGPLSSSDADDAIEVEKDEVLDVTLTAASPVQSHKIDLEVAGIKFNIEDDPEDSDPVVSETVNVEDYSTFGVGLYKVTGSAQLQNGESCSGSVLIHIKGNPLTTVAGIGALVVGAIGAAFLGISALATLRQFRALKKRIEAWGAEQLQRVNSGQDVSADELASTLHTIAKPPGIFQFWMLALMPALLLMGAAMPGGMPFGVGSILRLPRLGFRPKLSALGSLGGMLLGETVVTFLNFLAIQPLTGSSAIFGAVGGIVLGVTFDSAVKWWGTRDVNKVISRLERELADAKARQQRSPSGATPPPVPPTRPPDPPSEPPPGSPPPV